MSYPFLSNINKVASSNIFKKLNKLKCKINCDCGHLFNSPDINTIMFLFSKFCNENCVKFKISKIDITRMIACNNGHAYPNILSSLNKHDNHIFNITYERRDLFELTDEDILFIFLNKNIKIK